MDKPRAGSFSAYLEERQRRERSEQSASKFSAIGLLGILLQREHRELPVSELMSQSGMGILEFSDALKSLAAADMVRLSGAGDQQVAVLTPKGEEVANVSKA